ncbi:MAG: hypothetical protein AAFN81_29810, partial [Bacteroidota bacterium]
IEKLILLILLALGLLGCDELDMNQEQSPFVYGLEVESIRTIRATNKFLLNSLMEIDALLNESEIKYTYDFSSKTLELKYHQALREFEYFDRGRYTIYELCEQLNQNRASVMNSLFDSINNEVQWYQDQLEGLERADDVTEVILIGDGIELRQLYLKTLVFYNRLISVGLNYVQHVEKEGNIRVPLPVVNGDSLEVYVNSLGNDPLEEYSLRINNRSVPIVEGKHVINLDDLKQDTIWLVLEVEDKMTGTVRSSESYYLNEYTDVKYWK